MAEAVPRVVLASASPRRRELLAQIGMACTVAPSDIDESVEGDEDPRSYVLRLAVGKAQVAVADEHTLVIAADTTVDVDGTILGKPDDDDDARRMLRLLSGRTHAVHTGVAVRHRDRIEAGVCTTEVALLRISDDLLEWYIRTGEPHGKAGSYGIQSAAALLVDDVRGSVTNVIGLPLTLLTELIGRHGVALVDLLATPASH